MKAKTQFNQFFPDITVIGLAMVDNNHVILAKDKGNEIYFLKLFPVEFKYSIPIRQFMYVETFFINLN